jgi:hypothetical protein
VARIRSVKPALRTSQVVARWPMEVRYFWVLLWGYLDDKGRGLDIPKTIAGDCFPHDERVSPRVIDRWLALMATTKVEADRDPPVCRYEVAGARYLHSVYWDEHQKPNRPSPSQHPPCPVHERLTESLTESGSEPPLSPQVLELEGLTEGELEGARREPLTEPPTPPPQDPPPRNCPKHAQDRDPPPCGACRQARQALETWQAERRAWLDAAPRCPDHRGQLASNCSACASERKAAPWSDPSPDRRGDPATATPPTARTSTGPPEDAPSAPANGSPPTPTTSRPTRSPGPSATPASPEQPSSPASTASPPSSPEQPTAA